MGFEEEFECSESQPAMIRPLLAFLSLMQRLTDLMLERDGKNWKNVKSRFLVSFEKDL